MKCYFVSDDFSSRSGIGNYALKVYNGLTDRCETDKIHLDSQKMEIRVDDTTFARKTVGTFGHPVPFGLRCRNALPDDGDVYHISHPGISFLNSRPKVITVHDLVKFLYPRRPLTEYFTRKLFYAPVRQADHVIVDSVSTKNDLEEVLGINENVTVVYPGVDDAYEPKSIDPTALRQRYEIPPSENTLLYVGSEEPRKNFIHLIKLVARLESDLESVQLIKIGGPSKFGSRNKSLKAAKQHNVENKITFLDEVPENDLPAMYSMADLFLFPSLYEGFGFPPLEAMACGTPVITSNRASLPEVVGDAGVLLDPNDLETWYTESKELLTNRERYELNRSEGLARAEGFDWARTAEQIYGVYNQLCGF